MTAQAPAGEGGMILFNVLTVVAVSSAVVMLMLSSQDLETTRSQRMREAAQAAAYARAGELSAVVALRRDAEERPDTDNMGEAWASVGQQEIAIRGGRFRLAIADAQAKFNLNALVGGGAASEAALRAILAGMKAPPGTAERIVAFVRTSGPVEDLQAALAGAGIEPGAVAAMDALFVALPPTAGVNVNTADERLLAAMLGNPISARILAARRARSGLLTPADLTAAQVVLPPGMSFTSDHYRVRTEVQVGDTRQALDSLLERRRRDGKVEVVAIARRRETAAPDQAPPS